MQRRSILKSIAGSAAAISMTRVMRLSGDEPVTFAGPSPDETFRLLDRPNGKIPVIFDTDIGSDIDDTWALLYLLRCPELDCRLVATDSGQGMYRARLAAKFLQAAGRSDVPVGICPMDRDGVGNQQDWLGDYSLDTYPGTIYDDAVDAIIQTIHASAVPVTLICVGTVPNIAEALRRDPTICRNARFVGMHGSIELGYDGSPNPARESNVRYGVEPLRKTLAANWNCSITPLDTCGLLSLDGARYQRLTSSDDPGVVALMQNYRAWLHRVPWLAVKPDPDLASSILFDMVAVTMAFDESWFKMKTLPVVITDDGYTRVDPQHGRPVRCAMAWNDFDDYRDHLVERLLIS
ncbi:MAG: nucleoside hydrolase [Planctomycetota bacterium]